MNLRAYHSAMLVMASVLCTMASADTNEQQTLREAIEAYQQELEAEGLPPLPLPGIADMTDDELNKPVLPRRGGAAAPDYSNTEGMLFSVNFRDAPLSQVTDFIAQITQSEIVIEKGVNAVITNSSTQRTSYAETVELLHSMLAEKDIKLVLLEDGRYKAVYTWSEDEN